jgi:hypothetical protein
LVKHRFFNKMLYPPPDPSRCRTVLVPSPAE